MKYLYLIGFLLFSFLSLQNFKTSYIEYKLIDSEGLIVTVDVLRIPELCRSRNNRILVNYNGNEYSVLISNKKCVDGIYGVGNKVEMVYVSRFDKLFIQKSTSRSVYILSIVFFLFPIGFLIALLKPIGSKSS